MRGGNKITRGGGGNNANLITVRYEREGALTQDDNAGRGEFAVQSKVVQSVALENEKAPLPCLHGGPFLKKYVTRHTCICTQMDLPPK
jgi:hypothetical protein